MSTLEQLDGNVEILNELEIVCLNGGGSYILDGRNFLYVDPYNSVLQESLNKNK